MFKRKSAFGLYTISVGAALTVLAVFISIAGSTVSDEPVYAAISESQGQTIFEQKCSGCHTIGGGRGVGPDLKDITSLRDRDWLISFITAPDRLIAQGDPIAQQIVQEYGLPMPNLGVSNADAESILAYIEAQSGQNSPTPTTPPPVVTPPATTTAVNVSQGRDIFTGKAPLANNGPSCLSCHNVSGVGIIGGGTVGKDLTSAYSVIGEPGIVSLLKTTPFPMMKEIYTDRPLTDDEIASLTAFLKEASTRPTASTQNPLLFFIISTAGALLVIGAFQFLWRGRLSGVRRPLVKGGSK